MEYKNRGKKRQVKGSWRVASSRGLEKLSRAFRGTTIVQYSNNTPGGEEENPQEKKKRKRKKEEKNVKCHQAFKGPAIWKLVSKERFLVERRKRRLVISMVAFYSSREGGGVDESIIEREREREIRNTRYIFLSLLIATSERSSRTVCRYAREREKCGISR